MYVYALYAKYIPKRLLRALPSAAFPFFMRSKITPPPGPAGVTAWHGTGEVAESRATTHAAAPTRGFEKCPVRAARHISFECAHISGGNDVQAQAAAKSRP